MKRAWQREAEAAAFTFYAPALHPDAPVHGFDEILADVEAQAVAAHRACEIARQAHKLAEKQRNLVGWDARSIIFDTDADLRTRCDGWCK